jgi:hypothetical protein
MLHQAVNINSTMRQIVTTLILLTIIISPVLAQHKNRCATQAKIIELQNSTPEATVSAKQTQAKIKDWIANHANFKSQSILVIPVVVHVIYEDAAQNIPDSQIQLQLDILNQDYRRLNSDANQTPLAFIPNAADCEIEFCLAKRDIFGGVTTGIVRKQTLVNEIGSSHKYWKSNQGGDAIWDRDSYLNIWVCEIEQAGGILGYASVPAFSPPDSADGIVIDYRYFGTSTNTHYNKGRTATHEIGHWLNLQHIWGDDFGTCSIDDGVADTPLQTLEHFGMPIYPSLDSCTTTFPGTMFMNYMDYTDDSGMNLFTQGQRQQIWAALMTTIRDSLFHSKGCVPVGIQEGFSSQDISLYPNPAKDHVNLDLKFREPQNCAVRVFNSQGKLVFQMQFTNTIENVLPIDFSNKAKGLYLLEIASEYQSVTKKLIIE